MSQVNNLDLLKDFLFAFETGDTTAVVDDPIEFNKVDKFKGTNITLNLTNHKFTLQPGKTYKLMGGILISSSVSGAMNYQWRKVTPTPIVEIGNVASARSQNEAINFSNQPVAMAILSVPVGAAFEVFLRIASFTGVTPTTTSVFSYALIEEI